MVPEFPEFGSVLFPLPLLPGTVLPPGGWGEVAAGGWLDEPADPLDPLACAAQVSTSAAWHAPARRMLEISFMFGLLVSPRLPAAWIVFDRRSCPRSDV